MALNSTAPSMRQSALKGTAYSFGLSAVLLLCMFPYLQFGPVAVPSQVQPWAAVVAWVWVVVHALSGNLRLSLTQLLLLAFSVWFLVWVYSAPLEVETYLRRSGAFVLSMGIVLAVQYVRPETVWRCIRFAVPVWVVFGLIRYLAPGLYFSIIPSLVPSVYTSAARGSSSLAPEATDFGFLMVFLAVIALVARRALLVAGVRVSGWPIWLSGVGAFASLSGSGILGLALFLVMIYIINGVRGGWRPARAASVVMIFGVLWFMLSAVPETGIRGVDLLVQSIVSPSDLLQTTAVYRVAHNVVGFFGLVTGGVLGYGAGAFLVVGPRLFSEFDVGGMLSLRGYYADSVPLSLSESPLSFAAVIMLEYGFVGVAFMVLLFVHVARSRIFYAPLVLVFMVLTWVQSFPAAWPLFWVLLGLTFNEHFRRWEWTPSRRLEVPEV